MGLESCDLIKNFDMASPVAINSRTWNLELTNYAVQPNEMMFK